MDIIKKELSLVQEEIFRDFSDPFQDDSLLDFLNSGSKYIRSTLVILYLKSQNYELTKNIYKILSVGEIIHNASLLHDDVLDNADLRRGKLTFARKQNSKISILAGDYLLSYAINKISELENFKFVDIFNACIKKMTQAEIRQYFLRNTIPKEKDYLEICSGKTASLFSTIMEASYISLIKKEEKAIEFAEKFGIVFQIKNDLDKESLEIDKNNGIYTAKDVLGIEKTNALLDNYKEEMINIIAKFPDNIYKKSLEDLIKSL